MNRRLTETQNHHRRLFAWLSIYVLIIASVFGGLYFLTTQLHTHTLPVGNIEIIVPHSKYLQGESIGFKMVNNLNSSIFVINECPTEPLNVYFLQNNVWVRIHDQANPSDCPKEARKITVAANSSMGGNFDAWHNLFVQPGKYRIVAVIEHYNSLPYQDFEIVAPPDTTPKTTPRAADTMTPTPTTRTSRFNDDD